MISFSPNNIPNAIRMANTPPEAPIVGCVGSAQHVRIRKSHRCHAPRPPRPQYSSKKRRVPHALSMAEPNIHSPSMFPNQMPEARMQNAVGDQLPDLSMNNVDRRQGAVVANVRRDDGPAEAIAAASSISRKMPVLIPSSHVTAWVNGGRLNVIGSPVRRTGLPLVQFYSYLGCPMSRVFCETWGPHRSGTGTTGRLRCPAASTARTAKITLSFESFSVARVTLPTFCACSHSGLVVARHNTSYSAASPPGEASHVSVESFSKSFVSRCTFAGGAGAAANDASVAAFSRATCAT